MQRLNRRQIVKDMELPLVPSEIVKDINNLYGFT